ncbi:MAG: 6-bladed beta-propeller [Gemmatimonadota bacterium]|nr:6-bladed beta-propeller [Gemmatimonadota bacterium]MDE2873445.1 6-bladed beta-propeller [Gemmatimonadota bacterium]
MTRRTPAFVTAAIAVAACGSDAPPAGPRVEIDTIGDTTIVRTLSGSVWAAEARLVSEVSIGELDGPDEYLFGRIGSLAVDRDRNVYVFDRQSQHVRVFDPAGAYVATLGRQGEGPGEFARAETIAVLPDGRLLVRDPGNMRIQVFDPESGETDEWEYNSGNTYRPGSPLYSDARGRTFLLTSGQSWDEIVIVLGPDGTHLDTLPEPTSDHEPVVVSASTENSSVSSRVPFTPWFYWAVHSSGSFLTGLSSDYRIDLAWDDGVLRIERAHDPVAVSDGERAHRRESVVRMIRLTVPDWTWDGPRIPDHKPVFTQLLSGRDGRIWVRLATEGRRVENEDHDPENPFSQPVTWEESTRYDVFESDGTYLGVVVPPAEFSPHPHPVFDGDHVWAVARDGLGVERVVRYRIEVDDRGGGWFSSETSFAGQLPTESRAAMLPVALTMRQGGP